MPPNCDRSRGMLTTMMMTVVVAMATKQSSQGSHVGIVRCDSEGNRDEDTFAYPCGWLCCA